MVSYTYMHEIIYNCLTHSLIILTKWNELRVIMIIFITGIPVPIVAISAGISHDHYGNENL